MFLSMASLRLLLPFLCILFTYAPACMAKFHSTYPGTAADGVHACISNSAFDTRNITLRENCREAFKCVMENIPNQGQSILSSGAAILGFIPTVLLVLGSTNAEIIRIHTRYPILAFFLSIANINKRPDVMQIPAPTHVASAMRISLGPYGMVRRRDPAASTHSLSIWIIHILSALGASIVIWQTVEIGSNGVLSWACWTDFYPVIWPAMAVLHHMLSVTLMRMSLSKRRTLPLPSPRPGKTSQPTNQAAAATRSALMCWDLTQRGFQVEVKRKRLATWGKATADLVNNVNYLYGTAVFASITLVSGRVAIQKLAAFGIVTVAARIAAVFVLEDIEGEE